MGSRERNEGKSAERAKAILDDPLLQGALDKMEEEYITAWKHSKTGDKEERDILWQLV